MKLVIVESPTKAKTIAKFIGSEYKIESSYGHVRDLPKSTLGVDTENNFEPRYIIPSKQRKVVAHLKKLADKSSQIILATDEDREGEAIAWHLQQILLQKKELPIERIVFHEITKSAISHALDNPRDLDDNMVNAQQARRVLDRLVGYKLSPFLWKKVMRGLSAGRVQSIAVKLIVEREEEIKSFVPITYYVIPVTLETKNKDALSASLASFNSTPVPTPGFTSKEEAKQILAVLSRAQFSVAKSEERELQRHPLPPFITSTLQQAASQKLRFTAKKTMYLSQGLYEQGLITYMRTDSVNLSTESLAAAAAWIESNLGEKYMSHVHRKYSSKSRLAQEAHEAIRPTDVSHIPENINLEKDYQKIYELIWRRFVASQLPPALFISTKHTVIAESHDDKAELHISGSQLKFDGFLKIWPSTFEETLLPPIKPNDKMNLLNASIEEKHTEPPPRYTEASLIKILEKHGVGRPSTYAPTISVIQDRNYASKEQNKFIPTDIGMMVNKLLTENFPEIVDIEFTADMESNLDEVASGNKDWHNIIREFYLPFIKNLETKYINVEKQTTEEATDLLCEKCNRPMVIRYGRYGRFLSCSGFPDCKNAKALPKEPPKSTGITCSKCQQGEMVERRVGKGRARGKIFWGCNRYPECDNAVWKNPADVENKD